jgi:hypothetical protein
MEILGARQSNSVKQETEIDGNIRITLTRDSEHVTPWGSCHMSDRGPSSPIHRPRSRRCVGATAPPLVAGPAPTPPTLLTSAATNSTIETLTLTRLWGAATIASANPLPATTRTAPASATGRARRCLRLGLRSPVGPLGRTVNGPGRCARGHAPARPVSW